MNSNLLLQCSHTMLSTMQKYSIQKSLMKNQKTPVCSQVVCYCHFSGEILKLILQGNKSIWFRPLLILDNRITFVILILVMM